MSFQITSCRTAFLFIVFMIWAGVSQQSTAGEIRKLSLPELRRAVSSEKRLTLDFQVEGRVCASNNHRGLIVLDDGQTAELLELLSLPADLREGDHVIITGTNCVLERGTFAIQIGTSVVVETDGNHPTLTRSGTIFLEKGMRAFRVNWFNGSADVALSLEYETLGINRQKLPIEAFWHREPDQNDFLPGLNYLSYVDSDIQSVLDFIDLKPAGKGVVPDLDVSVRSRPEMSALVFSGFLKIPRSGLYKFYLTSDDGASLSIIDTPVSCEISPEKRSRVIPQTMSAGTMDQWITFDGTVTYAASASQRLELEVAGNLQSFQVTILQGKGIDPATLLHKTVRITGLKRESGIIAITPAQLEVVTAAKDQERILTKAFEIRELQPDDPIKSYRANIRGVVTMVTPRSLVLQDATGGVFVHVLSPTSENLPRPSELWNIEGHTGKGEFSPVLHVDHATYLGNAPLPKAVQPTQQQLASGSLDAERVEIEGVVLTISDREIKLLTRNVRVTILGDTLYPLPTTRLSPQERTSLVGAVVRLRGVYRAIWDMTTGSVQSSEMMLGNSTISVDEPATIDPFSAPLLRPSELLLFTSHPTALRRVRIRGQFLHARPPQLFFFDGASGFRAVSPLPLGLSPGDQFEVSGFPQLGGPSPVLLEARIRKIGHTHLPTPTQIQVSNLPDRQLDSTRVEIEGTLISDTVRQNERALEMQAGSNRFIAFVPAASPHPEGIEKDSILKLSGVYVNTTSDRPQSGSDPFELHLQSPADIVVLKHGPWWTKRHTITVIAVLCAALLLAASWANLLRRTVAKRSNELARQIEQREAVERHRAMEQERIRMAKDLHDELGSGLTEAGILSSLMRNPAIPNEQKNGYLEQLSALCCTLVTGLDEIVWAVNPRYDSVADLAGYFSLYAQRLLKLAGIECRLKIDDAITKDPLDSRTRHGIFLAFKEGLNNIVRHSEALHVHLTIEVDGGSLLIFLADDGRGFDRSINPPGSDGLRNMEDRMRSLGGSCRIETRPHAGTTLQFKISLKNNSI